MYAARWHERIVTSWTNSHPKEVLHDDYLEVTSLHPRRFSLIKSGLCAILNTCQ